MNDKGSRKRGDRQRLEIDQASEGGSVYPASEAGKPNGIVHKHLAIRNVARGESGIHDGSGSRHIY